MAVACKYKNNIDEVWAILCDPDFRVERSLALGELSAECEVEEDGDEVCIRMVREVTRELPSVLAKIFNPKQTLEFVERWRACDKGWEGELAISIKSQPVELSAKVSLLEVAGGCEYSVSHRCKAKIPLVGGKVEKFVLSQTDAGAKDELDYLKKKLA
ncbi:Uncharacterised protein [Zhongshania aliphaticivorans]|uniref:DUF2505 domain-containing protein n=1 Tax=Zhongshania aliphaticivorans TaxID=1470434 RepID=A0A5S9QAP9_9GAMM|nr:DUF2505 domain-containing protein [Zhongshania aliphaticivorans]CAA0087196.1 Uncharacterised protein [Zhongshania aliphaticivorans]CAA0114253.1 Uncharacterised protein [Zhongshania aliphaticivorans]